MDSLVPKADLEKPPEEANKVAGGALLSSDFLRKMALGMTTRGHICYMISQVRSKVSINPYEKTDARVTNASGGNALLHYSDWILEFFKNVTLKTLFQLNLTARATCWATGVRLFLKNPQMRKQALSCDIQSGMAESAVKASG